MNAIEFIRASLEGSRGWALTLIENMRDAPLTQPTSNVGNHPLWVLGHLVYSESFLFDCLICGKENRFPELKAMFDAGTTPTTDADAYPSMDELMQKWEEVRSALTAHLDTLTEDDLDKASHATDDTKAFFGTVGQCLSAAIGHSLLHAGQVTDARRAAGRRPLRM